MAVIGSYVLASQASCACFAVYGSLPYFLFAGVHHEEVVGKKEDQTDNDSVVAANLLIYGAYIW